MDVCTWLLENGVDSNHISWAKPREPGSSTGHPGSRARRSGASSSVTRPPSRRRRRRRRSPTCSLDWRNAASLKRLDPTIEPTMYRAPILSDNELGQLRSIEHVIRAGRVRRIQTDRIVFEGGEIPTRPDRPLHRLHGRWAPSATGPADLRTRPDHHPTATRDEPDVQRCVDRVSRSDPRRRRRGEHAHPAQRLSQHGHGLDPYPTRRG